MSYDLTFLVKRSASPPSTDDLVKFLAPRKKYRGEGSEIWYENEDTGVYFSFGLGSNEPTEEEIIKPIRKAGFKWSGLTFNMNYFRPSVFGAEAAVELDALVKEFSLAVDDPQNEGMGLGAFSKRRFIQGWNAGNKFAISAMKTQEGETLVNRLHLLPSSQIKSMWNWNYNREGLQALVGPEIYVTKIMPMNFAGKLVTLAVWSDAIPSIFPVVDFLGLYRQELAPKRFLRKSKPDVIILPMVDVVTALKLPKPEKRNDFSQAAYVTGAPTSKEIDFFRQLHDGVSGLQGVSLDSILDEEIFNSAKTLKVAYRSDSE